MKNYLDLIGRLAVGAFFVNEAYDCIAKPLRTKAEMALYGITWHPDLLLWTSAFFLTLGSILLVLGYRSRFAALLLLAYWLPVSFILNPFWHVPHEELRQTLLGLMQHLAIAGALMLIIAHGTGRFAVKKILASARS